MISTLTSSRQPNLQLKTWPKQVIGSLPLHPVKPFSTILEQEDIRRLTVVSRPLLLVFLGID
jgi:hypothetical protein